VANRTVIVTGSSGFLGSAICVDLSRDSNVVGMDRREPSEDLQRQATLAEWHHVDISDADHVQDTFRRIAETYQHIDFVLQMAAFYHFGRYWLPEYEKTNVQGLQNILDGALRMGVSRFIFAGSIASLAPPPPGGVLTEKSPSGNYSAYTGSKTIGEKLLSQYSLRMPAVVLRIGGVFTDWCELPPLYSLMRLWSKPYFLGKMIPGQGKSGFPYIHRQDLVACVRRVIERHEALGRFETLFACPSGSTTHSELFPGIRKGCGKGFAINPIFVPPKAARVFLYIKNRFKVLMGRKRYERRWMLDYVDAPLVVDATYTQERLQWTPDPERSILRQLPTLMRRFKDHRSEWKLRNIRRNEGMYEYVKDMVR
jgi:nucleoside-diphosphate-sugar epimerase